MNWDSRIISEAELVPYLAPYKDGGSADLRAQVGALIAQQRATWPMLRAASDGLSAVQYREFDINGARVVAQYNPGRIVSTSARVDAASISARPCFLCPANLPAEEKGIAFGDEFVILCNPFPVLPRHLVISQRLHTPQAINGNFAALLDLARALGEDYFALYNGPACGASAPDHMHFQACARSPLPITDDIENRSRLRVATDGIEVFALKDYHLNLLVARSDDRAALAAWFERTTSALARVTGAADEPLMNLVVMAEGGVWTVCLFPRGRHRPACYFAEGEGKFTISPAGIDLAGLLVVPQAEHFARLTGDIVAGIYREVTLDDERFARLLAAPGR